MAVKNFMCPKCSKRFTTTKGAIMHITDVHGGGVKPRKRDKRVTKEQEESLADISVNAFLKVAMGGELDPLERRCYVQARLKTTSGSSGTPMATCGDCGMVFFCIPIAPRPTRRGASVARTGMTTELAR